MTDSQRDMSSTSRRTVLKGAAVGAATVVTGSVTAVGDAAVADAAPGRHTGPPTASADQLHFSPGRTLRHGRPGQVGLTGDTVAAMPDDAARYLRPTPDHPDHPMYAGAALIAAKDGVVVQRASVGHAVRYGLDGDTVVELPAAERIPARDDTIWDLASMSKLFTGTAIAQLLERGKLDLHAPVVRYLPDFASHGKSDITLRHLLTHTSGLIPDPVPSLWEGYDTHAERVAAILDTTPDAPPDTEYVYSDLNFLTLGLLVEHASGQRLDEYVHEHITAPLGMHDTMYNPPERLWHRVAAEEYEPWAGRGMVWGSVHDENAWALGGVAGHAGVFSTTHDMAIFAQTYLNGGRYGRARILSEDTVRTVLHDYNSARFPAHPHGLTWELGLNWYMGAVASPVSFGHTGFTGTSIVVDPLAHQFVILLTNRVHPDREWGSNNPSRRAMADDLGLATAVRPAVGRSAWFTRSDRTTGGTGTATLTVPLPGDSRHAEATFRLWYDTEPTDGLTLAASGDGDTFTPVPFRLHGGPWRWRTDGTVAGYGGRRWLHAEARIPSGTTALRWTYATDPNSQGRGVYVDAIRVRGRHGHVFDSERHADARRIVAHDWHPSHR